MRTNKVTLSLTFHLINFDMATYYLQKVTNLKNVKGTHYKPRFDHYDTKTIDDMAEFLDKHNYCSEGTVKAVMSHITQYLAEQMRLGNKVRWKGIGDFEPSLAMTGYQEVTPEKGEPYIRTEGLHIDKVTFHPDKVLLQEANNGFSATRSHLTANVIPEERAFTPEERLALLENYFQQYRSITIKEYADLTFLPRTAANKELHQLAAGPNSILAIEGSRSHLRFVKKIQ